METPKWINEEYIYYSQDEKKTILYDTDSMREDFEKLLEKLEKHNENVLELQDNENK